MEIFIILTPLHDPNSIWFGCICYANIAKIPVVRYVSNRLEFKIPYKVSQKYHHFESSQLLADANSRPDSERHERFLFLEFSILTEKVVDIELSGVFPSSVSPSLGKQTN